MKIILTSLLTFLSTTLIGLQVFNEAIIRFILRNHTSLDLISDPLAIAAAIISIIPETPILWMATFVCTSMLITIVLYNKRKKLSFIIATLSIIYFSSEFSTSIILTHKAELISGWGRIYTKYILNNRALYAESQCYSCFRQPANVKRIVENEEFNYIDSLDDNGIRGNHHRLNPNPAYSGEKIMFIGDSFTHGMGAPINQSIPAYLEQLTGLQVSNGGKVGSDPIYDTRYLEWLATNKTEYTHIIQVFNEEDMTDISALGAYNDRFQDSSDNINLLKRPWWYQLYMRSFIVRLCVRQLTDYGPFLSPFKPSNQSVDYACDAIERFYTITQTNNLKYTLVFLPMINQTEWSSQLKAVKQYALKKGVNVIDLRSALLSPTVCYDDLYWPLDGHCTPKGYYIIAERICDNFY